MDEQERKDLIEDLLRALETRQEGLQLVERMLDALDQRHASEGIQLLDLMRAEQNLLDTLSVIRRAIDVLVRSAGP